MMEFVPSFFYILLCCYNDIWGAAKAGYLGSVSFMDQDSHYEEKLLEPTLSHDLKSVSGNYRDEGAIHDTDVKIPGRHYPKRPYVQQVREDVTNPFALLSVDTFEEHPQNSEPQEVPSSMKVVGPSFDRNLTRNIIVQAGKSATLACRVRNMNKTSISFIRLKDLHILSVDKYKYSTDERISISYEGKNGTWTLKIQNVRESDAGIYECQVSTKPVLSFIINLEVEDASDHLLIPSDDGKQPSLLAEEVPRAYVVNSPDIFVHRGSLINLTCVVNHGMDQLVYIYWYHGSKLVDTEGRRWNVEMRTPSNGQTISELLVNKARSIDSGKYNCKPSNGDSAVVNLHVLNGEQQAAMQTNRSSKTAIDFVILFIIIWVVNL